MRGFRCLMLASAAILCACSSQNDDYAKKAGLIIDSHDFAFPSGSLVTLARNTVAFRTDSSVIINPYKGLDAIVPQKTSPSTLILISDGAARICLERKALSRYDCGKLPNFRYEQESNSIAFDIVGAADVANLRIVSSQDAVTTGAAGDAYIPAHAIVMTAVSPYDQTHSVRINRLNYVGHDELLSLNLQDVDGSKINFDGDKPAMAALPNGDRAVSNPTQQAKPNYDEIKKAVTARIAADNNIPSSDVVEVSAAVSPMESGKDGAAYHVNGSFRVETDQPSNAGDAISQRAKTNFCRASSRGCSSEDLKIKHTVYFDASAVSANNLDSNSALRIDYKVSIDRPLEVADSSSKDAPSDVQNVSRNSPEISSAGEQPATQGNIRADAANGAGDQTLRSARSPSPAKRTDPILVSSEPPKYPTFAIRPGATGTTLIQILVCADGRTCDVKVLSSSGRRPFDQAAIEGVRKWKFKPATLNGTPIQAVVNVPINFGGAGSSVGDASAIETPTGPDQPQGTGESQHVNQSASEEPQGQGTTTPGSGPSFDCARASTPTEMTICQTPILGTMDSNVANEYQALMRRASPEQSIALRDSQRAWIRDRSQCGSDTNCLIQSMNNRIPQLRQIVR